MNAQGLIVPILGRANAGKSTLFNLLGEGPRAIISPIPGTTRDRLEGRLAGSRLRVMDTGGIGSPGELGRRMDNALMEFLPSAAAVLVVVNPGLEISDDERKLAEIIRKEGKPALVVCNKCDKEEDDLRAYEFARLGLGLPLPTSAASGRNIKELRRRVAGLVAVGESGEYEDESAQVQARCAIIGQPNVGKSSVFNRLLNQDRSLVDSEPGTTRDPVRARLAVSNGMFEIVDTAGVSHRWRKTEVLQRKSQEISLKTLAGIDVAVLVLDLTVSLARQDLRLIRLAVENGAALAVAMNKADLIPPDRMNELARSSLSYLQKRFPQLGRFPVIFCSAKTGDGMAALPATIGDLFKLRNTMIPKPALAEVAYGWPSSGGAWRISQVGTRPPEFSASSPGGMRHDSRFVANRLRESFGLHGVPILIRWRDRRAR